MSHESPFERSSARKNYVETAPAAYSRALTDGHASVCPSTATAEAPEAPEPAFVSAMSVTFPGTVECRGCGKVTDDGLKHLQKQCPHINITK